MFATRINQIAKRRERAIAKLRQSSQSRPHEEAAVLSERSLPWALDVDEPSSSLVARCDTAEYESPPPARVCEIVNTVTAVL
jgi:hypothetical protein